MIQIKRVYDVPQKSDGARVLVDRLWPRGLSKESAKIDLWLKDIAPSETLRKWFNHEAGKWTQFKKDYFKELKGNRDALALLQKRIEEETVTLLYAAKDTEHNNAVALREFLSARR